MCSSHAEAEILENATFAQSMNKLVGAGGGC